jgi:RNA polymerase sigma factor (sigma-70 family)
VGGNRGGVRSVATWLATEPARPGWLLDRPSSASLPALADAGLHDAALVELARHGDGAAFGQLVSRNQEIAFRVAFVITGDADDATDAAQQGFIKAYRALGRFRAGRPFRPWLVRIVANEACNARRAAASRSRLGLRLARSETAADSPEEAVLAAERAAGLAVALARARDDDRLVIACRFFFDMSEADMAVALDCAPGTVKSRLSRALGRLRASLLDPRPPDEAAASR